MCHVLRSRAELKHRKNLREGINGQPEPQHMLGAPEPCSLFVQLEVRELEGAKAALVEGLCVLVSMSHPGDDGGLSVALRPVRRRKGPDLRQAQRAPLRSAEKGFSDGTRGCRVAH
jgi:hypothetical protein